MATVYHKTQHKNGMCVHHLIYIGYNGNLLSSKLKGKKSVRALLPVTHYQARIQGIETTSINMERFHIMGRGSTNHYGILKSAELNNRNKVEENIEKEKQYWKETELHKTDALKVWEHVTEKGISIYQYNNNPLETLLLWNGINR